MTRFRQTIFNCLFLLLLGGFADAQVIITEVFANAKGRKSDQGQEWFEVKNVGTKPTDLSNAVVTKLDGKKLIKSWQIKLGSNLTILETGQFAVFAQKKDLGVDLCLEMPIILINDPVFTFKNSGNQTLCIKTNDNVEDCATINKSGSFPDGQSRFNRALTLAGNDDLKWWKIEDCEISPGFFASPGAEGGFCLKKTAKLTVRYTCPALEQKPEKPTRKSLSTIPTCHCTNSDFNGSTKLFLSLLLVAFMFIRPKSDC